jgi:hypothetical protein
MTPYVTIKQRATANGTPFSETFVYYGGSTFCSRNWWTVDDTPHQREAIAQDFLRRLKRFPSTIAPLVEPNGNAVAATKLPALSVVKDK